MLLIRITFANVINYIERESLSLLNILKILLQFTLILTSLKNAKLVTFRTTHYDLFNNNNLKQISSELITILLRDKSINLMF